MAELFDWRINVDVDRCDDDGRWLGTFHTRWIVRGAPLLKALETATGWAREESFRRHLIDASDVRVVDVVRFPHARPTAA